MNQTEPIATENIRNRGRFSWVRRLMQGQHRQNGQFPLADRNISYNSGYYKTNQRGKKPKKSITINEPDKRTSNTSNDQDSDSDTETDTGSGTYSDQMTENSDNLSTIPLKSVLSMPSTASPSVLSADNHADANSINASTAETSIAPSSVVHLNPHVNRDGLPPHIDRDSESIVTLASSTRRIRRRSLDTTSSTAGIAPASIMERISTQANPGYANSIDRDYESQISIPKST